jgi:hypothetical protein
VLGDPSVADPNLKDIPARRESGLWLRLGSGQATPRVDGTLPKEWAAAGTRIGLLEVWHALLDAAPIECSRATRSDSCS